MKFQLLLLLVVIASSYCIPSPNNILLVSCQNWQNDDDGNNVQDSKQIIDVYAQRYGVPSSNKVDLTLTNFDNPTYNTFYTNIILPITTKINQLGKQSIEVILLTPCVPFVTTNGKSIDSLIMIPFIFPSFPPDFYTDGNISNPYLEKTPTFDQDWGRFDSSKDVTINGTTYDLYLVTRLDGMGRVWGIINRLDASIYANKYAWFGPEYQNGIIYVDNAKEAGECANTTVEGVLRSLPEVQTGNVDTNNNLNLQCAMGAFYQESGLPITVMQEGCGSYIGDPKSGATNWANGSGAALKAPNALAFGGFISQIYATDVWEWNPGSMAVETDPLVFYYGIRSQTYQSSWAWGALNDGVTAVAGMHTYYEVLADFPRPNVALYYFLRGFTFAEISLYSNPKLALRACYVGDPLLNPFNKSKTPTNDSTYPVFVTGYPTAVWSNATGWIIDIRIDQSLGPEVVRATITWDAGAINGSASTKVWGSWHRIPLADTLPQNSTIIYQVLVEDPAGFSTVSSFRSITTGTTKNHTYNKIPGTINFVDFDDGGEGLAYHDADFENKGSYSPRPKEGVDTNVGAVTYTMPGEWLTWTVDIDYTTTYNITIRVNDYYSTGGFSLLEVDDIKISDPFNCQGTAGGNIQATLTSGRHVLKWTLLNSTEVNTGPEFFNITFAFLIPPSPMPTPSVTPSITPSVTPAPKAAGHSNQLLIVGIAVGAAVLALCLIIIVLLILFCWKRSRDRNEDIPLTYKVKNIKGKITVQEKLGGGNFGEVYKGLWNDTTPVALKQLKDQSDIQGFLNEATMLQNINHPSIVRYLGFYEAENGQKYIVMEYLPLGSLDMVVRRNKNSLTVDDLVDMAKQAAAGMNELSTQNIIHRDLALRNLLVTQEQEHYVVKVGDFGLSRATESGIYHTDSSTMPVRWCAPEVLEKRLFSIKSDVWSFGVVLWELFSWGKEPYVGMSNAQVAEQVTGGFRLSPPPSMPEPMADLLEACLATDPQQRPSFAEIHMKLKEYQEAANQEALQRSSARNSSIILHQEDINAYNS